MARHANSACVSRDGKDNRKGARPRRAAGCHWQNQHMRHPSLNNQSRQAQRSQAGIWKRRQRDEMAALRDPVKVGIDDKFENKSSLDEEVVKIFPFHDREFFYLTNSSHPKMYGSNCEVPLFTVVVIEMVKSSIRFLDPSSTKVLRIFCQASCRY